MNGDVVVIGGGSAGLAAAVSAARAGAEVVLVERGGMLGGMATQALVHSVCGLYRLRTDPGAELAHQGFPSEFAERLIRTGAASGPVRMGRVDVLPHTPPGFAMVADEIAAACASLRIRLHSELISVERHGSVVEAIRVITHGVTETLSAAAFIDTSGDATLCWLAAAATHQEPPSRLQRPAFIFALADVAASDFDSEARVRVAWLIAEAVRAGELDQAALGSQLRATERGSEVYVTVDLEASDDFDPCRAPQLTELEQAGRRLAGALCAFLRRHHRAFSQARIASLPSRVGIRESRRVVGIDHVSAEAVLRGDDHPDVVALGTWPMELREKATGPRWRFPTSGRPTQIPLGALRAAGLDNVWTAGRCLSCEHEAQAALRVIGTCLATGQAAGAAAAWQAQHHEAPSAARVRRQLDMAVPG